MKVQKITVPELAKITTFCHAVIVGDFIYVFGQQPTTQIDKK